MSEERVLRLGLKRRTSHSLSSPQVIECVKRRRLELLMRAFTLGDQFGPSTSQLFSKPLFLQRDNIIKLDIVSLRFSHYDLGRVEQKFRCFLGGGRIWWGGTESWRMLRQSFLRNIEKRKISIWFTHSGNWNACHFQLFILWGKIRNSIFLACWLFWHINQILTLCLL